MAPRLLDAGAHAALPREELLRLQAEQLELHRRALLPYGRNAVLVVAGFWLMVLNLFPNVEPETALRWLAPLLAVDALAVVALRRHRARLAAVERGMLGWWDVVADPPPRSPSWHRAYEGWKELRRAWVYGVGTILLGLAALAVLAGLVESGPVAVLVGLPGQLVVAAAGVTAFGSGSRLQRMRARAQQRWAPDPRAAPASTPTNTPGREVPGSGAPRT